MTAVVFKRVNLHLADCAVSLRRRARSPARGPRTPTKTVIALPRCSYWLTLI